MLKKNWIYSDIDFSTVEKIRKHFCLKDSVARLIVKRIGSDYNAIESFIKPELRSLPDPSLMTELEKGAERLVGAIINKEKIAIYGDYDADGITATALLLLFLKEINYPVDFYIPDRIKEGYGLNKEAIDLLKAKGIDLIVTVDCGISDYEVVEYSRQKGIDFIVTDHHIPPKILPNASAVINPKRKDCKFPFKELAGVGVAFYLLIELRKQLRKKGYFNIVKEPNLKTFLDLVAIGTIADMVPLLGPNRVFVKFGLEEINSTKRKGLKILREELLIETLDVRSVSFRIAPRINASGRVSSPIEALKLLLTSDEDKAKELVKQLHKSNSQRQKAEEQVLNEALKQVEQLGNRYTYCLYSPNWHQGVLGIVAGKLVDRLKKPCFVFTKEKEKVIKGSGRSIEGFPLDIILADFTDFLLDFGGHRLACGLEMKEEVLSSFSEYVESRARSLLNVEEFCEIYNIDSALPLNEIDDAFFKQLGMLEPFGYGNPEPVFLIDDIEVVNFRLVGAMENHLKLYLKKNGTYFNAIGFSLANNGISENSRISAIGVPKQRKFNGTKSWDFYIKDYVVSGNNKKL
jgi:single-stranded-DNA-specific exonuclease